MITKNDQLILKALNRGSGSFRKKIEKDTKMQRTSFHISLKRLISEGFARVEKVEGRGNPTKLYITEDGKIMANAFKEIA